jgi:hypothetical protein
MLYDGSEFTPSRWANDSDGTAWTSQLDGKDDIATCYPGNGTWWV